MHLQKTVENRSEHFLKLERIVPCPLIIHASKTWDQKGYEFLTQRMDEYVPSKKHHVFGALQGIVRLVDIVTNRDELTTEQRRWFFGDVGLVFEKAKEFKRAVPWRGQLGIFYVPDNVIGEKLR